MCTTPRQLRKKPFNILASRVALGFASVATSFSVPLPHHPPCGNSPRAPLRGPGCGATLFYLCPCGASPCGAPRPALRGPLGAPRGPARAAQGAMEAGAQPLAPPTSPTLASLAMGAAQRHLSAWRPGKGGGSARGQAHAGRGSANHGPRPLGFWASVVIAQPLPKGRGCG